MPIRRMCLLYLNELSSENDIEGYLILQKKMCWFRKSDLIRLRRMNSFFKITV